MGRGIGTVLGVTIATGLANPTVGGATQALRTTMLTLTGLTCLSAALTLYRTRPATPARSNES